MQRRGERVGARQPRRCRGSSAAAGRRGTSSRGRTPSSGRGRRACRRRSAAAGRAASSSASAAHEAAGLGEVGRQHAAAVRAPLEDALSSVDGAARATGRTGRSGAARRAPRRRRRGRAGCGRRRAGRGATSMPCARRCSAGPMPDSISSCGDCSAPADSSTSRRAAHVRAARRRCAPRRRPRGRPSSRIARRVRAGDHVQVRAAEVGRQVGLGGAEALAVLVRHLVEADAFLARAVEVGG